MSENARKFDHRIKTQSRRWWLFWLQSMKSGVFRVGLRMTPQAVIGLRKSVLVTSAGSSTRIEGSKLSDEEVKKLCKGLASRNSLIAILKKYKDILRRSKMSSTIIKIFRFEESVITSLHKELLKYSTKDDLHRGEYKHKENIVGILDAEGGVAKIMFETTPAYLTPKEMNELVLWTAEAFEKERFHPLLIIANFIIEFLKIHPFEDGNGRLSRILTNLLLLRAGYPFVEYVSHEQIIEQRKGSVLSRIARFTTDILDSKQACGRTGNNSAMAQLLPFHRERASDKISYACRRECAR